MTSNNTFADSVAFVESFIFTRPSKYYRRLDRSQRLLELLDNPQQKYPIIHIGGTSGKGSTSHIAAAILEKAGYKVGLHTSPHLQIVTERFQINHILMPEKDFVVYVNKLKPAIQKMIDENSDNPPTYFEILVAIAFLYFADQKVDYAVIEVGLGGKFDSTNVCLPKVSVVTNVGLDHTQILGNTIEKIINEKMQIIKPGIKSITGVTQKSALQLIKAHANNIHAPLYILNQNFSVKNYRLIANQSTTSGQGLGGSFDYQENDFSLKDLYLNLKGQFQAENAALAIRAVRLLDIPIEEKAIREALATITFPGRFEIAKIASKQIIFDGAHNPMKMKAFVNIVKQMYPDKKFPIIFSVKYDKDQEKMIQELLPISSEFWITTFARVTDLGNNIMAKPENIVTMIRSLDKNISVKSIPLKNLPQIIQDSDSNEIIVTGSLYLVGAIRDILNLSWKLQ